MKAVFDHELRQAHQRTQRHDRRFQDGLRRAHHGRHPRLQGAYRRGPYADDLVRVHRSLPSGRPGACHSQGFRVRLAEERPRDFPQPDLRLRGAQERHGLRQRVAASDYRYAGAAGTGAQYECAGRRKGLQERPDVHEDPDRAGVEIAPAGPQRLVFHQYSGESRRRSAGRAGLVPFQGSQQVVRPGIHSAEAICIPTCTSTFTTRSASSTIRRAATPRKAGTTSTSSVGSATPCRSRSTSSAAIPFWPPR